MFRCLYFMYHKSLNNKNTHTFRLGGWGGGVRRVVGDNQFREGRGGLNLSEEKEEEEEEEGKGPVSGREVVWVENVVVKHRLYTYSASSFGQLASSVNTKTSIHTALTRPSSSGLKQASWTRRQLWVLE